MSETLDIVAPFRGDVKSVAGLGTSVIFVTVHPERHATGLNWIHLGEDRPRSELRDFPGGTAIAADTDSAWIAGVDGRIYAASASAAPNAIGPKFDPPASALVLLSNERIGVVAGKEITVLSRKNGNALQTLPLGETGTVAAADPSGKWLAVGTSSGTVTVFESESTPEFVESSSARLHEGEVTSLLFERDDLRFFSSGADLKLLSTHARGKLEPEDKGRANVHTDRVGAMIWGPEDRLLTGSRDGTVKSWPRVGGVKPSTQKDGVAKVVAMCLVKRHGRDHLVLGCEDNTIRVLAIDPSGKVAGLIVRVKGAIAGAKDDLAGTDPHARESAMRTLSEFGDAPSLELLANQANVDLDHGLRVLATGYVAKSDHPRASTLLEALLKHADPAVRSVAFEGPRRQKGESDLRVLDLALRTGSPEIGKMAVEALRPLASKDDQALARLTSALTSKTPEIRQAALVALESAYPPDSPQANLAALGTDHADVRRAALVRLRTRGLIAEPSVQSALRRRSDDPDPEVRRVAFLLSLFTRPPLLEAIRSRDPELQRQIAELDDSTAATEAIAPKKGKKTKADAESRSGDLTDDDLAPLLQSAASRSVDVSLLGARALAILGDPRALGLLLQLSREAEKNARVEVCRALAALNDPGAVERLRSLLYDPELIVRDAAFTALARIHDAEPLTAASAGLNAPSENIRQRGLQLLIAEIRKNPPKGSDAPSLTMLADSLNDSFATVRTEAFKSALNLKVNGGGPATLRFTMRSLHPDIRREALTESMAVVAGPGGWDVLLEFFNDPDASLRTSAFEFATKKTKGLEVLDAALGSRYPDLRKSAVEGLLKKHTTASQALLGRALDDEDRDVRLKALGALVEADARPALVKALANTHADVRLRAAKALARHGDPAALPVMLELASTPEPLEQERKADWQKQTEAAIDGLGELGDPASLASLIPLVDSPHQSIRKAATNALIWVSRPDTLAPLRDALRHEDPRVQVPAALGLAFAGDASVGPMVFSQDATNHVGDPSRLAAALALAGSASGDGHLIATLDDKSEKVRIQALLVLLMQEWKSPTGTASRCLAALASRDARTRLLAAEAAETLTDSSALAAFIVGLINDKSDKADWKISPEIVDDLGELLVLAEPQLRARTARLLKHLNADEQDAWDQAWAIHSTRFAAEIAALRKARTTRNVPKPQCTRDTLRELSFGAYVGLVREQVGTNTPAATRVRQMALSRLSALAKLDPKFAPAARPVLVQALGDPNASVRVSAFDMLPGLGMDPSELAAEALASGMTDLGVKGLEILAGAGTGDQGRTILDDAMASRRDDLATEAAKLLIEREGAVSVAGRALNAVHEPLRRLAVSWLTDAYDKDATARDLLRGTLKSRYAPIREIAAHALSAKKDSAAFDALVELLNASPKADAARQVILALGVLGDPRAASAFLDRTENDPSGTAPIDDLILGAGKFRSPEIVERLFNLWEKDRKRSTPIVSALLTISGHDQSIDDAEDERPDRTWEQKQHPRRDEVLARLIARITAPGEKPTPAVLFGQLIPAGRWSRSKAVDPVLANLLNHADETTRRRTVEALGWRIRKRGSDHTPLVKALASKDPIVQLVAAEGLALAKRGEGMSVLLASIEYVSDLDLRRRAVLALGELADERGVDVLMKLASEDGHALQDAASEAIGHLGKSKEAASIGRLLERQASGTGSVSIQALRGLRWLNTASGWRLIRSQAADTTSRNQSMAVELLAHNDDPATRDLLLKLLADDDSMYEEAYASARKLWGPDALEPDEALLQNESAPFADDFDDALKRVSEKSAPDRIFAILPKCADDDIRATLGRSLLQRKPLPVAEAIAAIDSLDPTTSGVAAHILGRAGSATKGAGASVERALARWWKSWLDRLRDSVNKSDYQREEEDPPYSECVRIFCWAAGRLGVGITTLTEIARAIPEDDATAAIRESAIEALSGAKTSPTVLDSLEEAAERGDPDSRSLAAQALSRDDPKRASRLAEKMISDRSAFQHLTKPDAASSLPLLRDVAKQAHYQGIAIPALVHAKDVKTLGGVAEDRTLNEAARLGAIEGLASIQGDNSDDVLRRIGLNEADEDEIRKAAWRGLRRSKRARNAPKAEVRA